jgi:hypothetical protein
MTPPSGANEFQERLPLNPSVFYTGRPFQRSRPNRCSGSRRKARVERFSLKKFRVCLPCNLVVRLPDLPIEHHEFRVDGSRTKARIFDRGSPRSAANSPRIRGPALGFAGRVARLCSASAVPLASHPRTDH